MRRASSRITAEPATDTDIDGRLLEMDFVSPVTTSSWLTGVKAPCGLCVSTPHKLKNPLNAGQRRGMGAVFLQNKIRKQERWLGKQLALGIQNERNNLLFPPGYVLSLVRLAPKAFDGDNLQAAFKSVRDGIAAHFGFDDGSAHCWWEYRQEKSKEYLIRVELYCQMCWMKAEYGATGFEPGGRRIVSEGRH